MEYGSFDQPQHLNNKKRATKRVILPLALSVLVVALILVAVSDERVHQSFELLVGNAEQVAEATALQGRQLNEARNDQTRAKELGSLLAAANAQLQTDEQTANQLAIKAQRQAQKVNLLRQKVDLSSPGGINGLNDNLESSAESEAAQQNLLLQQEANLKHQEQALLLGESEQSNMAAEDEQNAHNIDLNETKDEGLIESENSQISNDKSRVLTLMAQEKPVMIQVENLQTQVNAARVQMQQAMNKMDQYKEAGQAAQLEAQMNANSKRRNDRDSAEEALNRAVAKEQRLQNGPNHMRLKLKGAAAARLTLAQQQVKKAQAALAAAYSETYTPTQAAPSAPSPNAILAQKQEDAATAKVEQLMTQLNAAKNKLGLLENRITKHQNSQVQNQNLLQMIENRAQNEEGSIAVVNGRAAASRQQASQDNTQVATLEQMAQAVQKRIALLSQKRTKNLGRLTSSEANKKKLVAKLNAARNAVNIAAATQSMEQKQAAAAYSKVAAQARQIAALKAEQREDISQAAQLLAQAHQQQAIVGQQLNAPEPLPPAPFPTVSPPAAV